MRDGDLRLRYRNVAGHLPLLWTPPPIDISPAIGRLRYQVGRTYQQARQEAIHARPHAPTPQTAAQAQYRTDDPEEIPHSPDSAPSSVESNGILSPAQLLEMRHRHQAFLDTFVNRFEPEATDNAQSTNANSQTPATGSDSAAGQTPTSLMYQAGLTQYADREDTQPVREVLSLRRGSDGAPHIYGQHVPITPPHQDSTNSTGNEGVSSLAHRLLDSMLPTQPIWSTRSTRARSLPSLATAGLNSLSPQTYAFSRMALADSLVNTILSTVPQQTPLSVLRPTAPRFVPMGEASLGNEPITEEEQAERRAFGQLIRQRLAPTQFEPSVRVCRGISPSDRERYIVYTLVTEDDSQLLATFDWRADPSTPRRIRGVSGDLCTMMNVNVRVGIVLGIDRIDALVGLEVVQAVNRGFITYGTGAQLWQAWCGNGEESMSPDLASPLDGEVWSPSADNMSSPWVLGGQSREDPHTYDYHVSPRRHEGFSLLDEELLSLRLPQLV